MRTRIFLITMGLGATLAAAGCGVQAPRMLESITVTPAIATAQNEKATFTATGHFNTDPMTVPNMPVSWLEVGPAVDPPGPGYVLKAAPLTAQCLTHAAYTVVAYAPSNPDAPSSGPMPSSVFSALVLEHNTSSAGGFVAGTAKMNCP